MPSPAPEPARRDWFVPAAVGVFMLALAVRFAYLGRESLWNDELASYAFSSGGLIHAVRSAIGDNGPPLYYVLQSLVNQLITPTEVTMRLVPALAGALAVLAVAYLGRRLYGSAAGIIAGILTAVSWMPLNASQEARAYSLGMLLSVLVALTLVRAAESGKTLDYVLHGAAIAAAAYTHLFGLIVAAGIVLGVLIRPRLLRRLGWRWFAALGGAALAWAPWAVVLVGQTLRVSEATSWHIKAPGSISATIGSTLANYAPWGDEASLLVVIGFGSLVFAGAFLRDDWLAASPTDGGAKRAQPAQSGTAMEAEADVAPAADADTGVDSVAPQKDAFAFTHADRTAVVGMWFVIAVVAALVVSKYVIPIFDARQAVMAAPAAYLLAGYGMTRVWRPAAIAVSAILIAYTLIGMPDFYRKLDKERWRPVTAYLIQHRAADDGLVSYASFVQRNVDAYAKMLGEPEGMRGLALPRGPSGEDLAVQVEAYAGAQDGSFWLVESHVPMVKANKTSLDIALREKGWSVSQEKYWPRIIVRHYVRGAEQPPTVQAPSEQAPGAQTPSEQPR